MALMLAAQEPPADGVDPEVSATGRAWAQCTRRQIDATINTSATDDQLVDGAFAACAAEEAAVRAAAGRVLGADSIESFITQVKSDAREVILNFLRAERRRS